MVLGLTGLLIGMSKTGIHGAGMIAVPLLALEFGGKASSGLLLPILIMADVFGVAYYHRHASWGHLWKLFPWAALGVVIGTVAGNYIDDGFFKTLMGGIIFASVVIMLWLEHNKKNVPDNYMFSSATGIAGGFTTMVGNLAGSVMSLYLLSMRMPKNVFIGTSAWFFMITNWFKVPFHVFAWHTITFNTLLLSVTVLPLIMLGAGLGIFITKRIPEQAYRKFIIAMIIVAALVMVL